MNAHTGSTVEFSDVSKSYGKQRVLHGFDLTVGPGELVSLLGPSGCGKTTALRVLAGLEDATSGAVLVNGADVSRQPTNKRDIGMVFQSYSLFPHLSAVRNVMFGLAMRRMRAREAESRALAMLELVGLGAHAERYPHQLSGGQQQRVALARALVTEPRVLLLDEPLSALDAKVREQLREEIRRIQLRLGITTVFVTHDQEEALAISDRVAVMNAGGIEQIGSPEQLYTRPATPFVARFVGQSNRVRGVARGGMVDLYGHQVPLLEHADAAGTVEVLVRPEDIELSSAGIPAVVLASSFLGSMRRTSVRLGDGTVLVVQHSVGQNPQPGESLGIGWSGRAVARSSTTETAYMRQ
ncbi:ABC transporter ATP-binding protein [Microterricola pindariensis]|uniref:Spermidine/putrescine ABC transporter ATP-binding protein n=1 Tax=Microterricola pindariensis TaxID=478010 RepID=A0ABX5ATF5_9MICO|nr:ABC transporter ATP-binding protein [Microterricola pindariensis]PPL15503.1 spermidine/putrescine ABC transporter ATP-binding protein [Microterricola pindariensis]